MKINLNVPKASEEEASALHGVLCTETVGEINLRMKRGIAVRRHNMLHAGMLTLFRDQESVRGWRARRT